MIIVKYCGGLGNQMFQYALQNVLEHVYPELVIKADISHYMLLEEHNGFELENVFDIKLNHATENEIKLMSCGFVPTKKVIKLPYSLRYKIAHNWQHKYQFIKRIVCKKKRKMQIIGYCHNSYNDLVLNLNTDKDWYLDGMWQNVNYYRGHENEIRDAFKFRKGIEETEDIEMLRKIRESKSVSVHVRRGDFVNSQFDICRKEYYVEAMNLLQKELGEDVKYFFFSDDVDFVAKEFEFIKNKEIVVHDKLCSYIDMTMMKECKHNIISNSTFAFWGAFLGNQQDRKVIAPAYSIRDSRGSYELSVPETWTQIKV
jgi:hypothetical protein